MKRIKHLWELAYLAQHRKSVIAEKGMLGGHHCPAAFVMNLQARTVYRLLQAGLYVYEPKTKEATNGRPEKV